MNVNHKATHELMSLKKVNEIGARHLISKANNDDNFKNDIKFGAIESFDRRVLRLQDMGVHFSLKLAIRVFLWQLWMQRRSSFHLPIAILLVFFPFFLYVSP